MKNIIALILCFAFSSQISINAQEPIVFIYDASGSMWGKLEGKTKMEVAKSVLTSTINALPEDQPIGLVAYGHRKERDCNDVEWLLKEDNLDKAAIRQSLEEIKPKGRTPLAISARMVLEELKLQEKRATVILITDGIESCGGDLCELVKSSLEVGLEFKMHIVGFGLQEGEDVNLRCAAEASDGQYFDAQNSKGLSDALQQATVATIDRPEENFGVSVSKNGELIDAYVKCLKEGSDKSQLTLRTYRDTVDGYLLPGKYEVRIKPLENSDVSGQSISVVIPDSGRVDTTVKFDSGILAVEGLLNQTGWDCTVKVIQPKTGKSVASLRTYGREHVMDLDPGKYDVEFNALKIQGSQTTFVIKDVEVPSGDTTRIHHNFTTGKLTVGASSDQGLIDATVRIVDQSTGKSIASGRTYSSPSSNPHEFLLTPGKLDITIKALPLSGEGAEVTKSVELKAGEVLPVDHLFEFGRLVVKVVNHYGLSDATVNVMDVKGKKNIAGGRTYTSETSNPKDFLMTPGRYMVEIKEVGKDASGKKTIEVEIKAGETVEQEIRF